MDQHETAAKLLASYAVEAIKENKEEIKAIMKKVMLEKTEEIMRASLEAMITYQE